MYIPKDYDPPNSIKIQKGQQERRRKTIANHLHQQIIKRQPSDGNALLTAVIEWYETRDRRTKGIVLDQVIKLMDMQAERADQRDTTANFGPISALELLGVALAVYHGWLRCDRS